MKFEEFDLVYPSVNPGAEKTVIKFFSGEPQLAETFFSGAQQSAPRLFVTDTVVGSLPSMQHFLREFDDSGSRGKDGIIILDSGEEFKTIDTVLKIVKAALDRNFGRNAVFVGIGGGVITDMTAFAASIFKRGAKCELVPTTLLSMVDAAVGGKTGCDFDSYKNMIGTFFPASTIYIFPEFTKSLDDVQYRSGLGEVMKTALLSSESLYDSLKKRRNDVFERKNDIVQQMIATCVRAKANVVEQDFTEKNIRRNLNLGHTFAHALETLAGLGTVAHGDAVAWGIARALVLGNAIGICHSSYCDEVISTLESYGWETGAIHSALNAEGTDKAEIAKKLIEIMKKDKKNVDENIRFVLQTGPCATLIREVSEEKVFQILQ